MIFEMETPSNVLMIEMDKHSHVWLPNFLLLFYSAFEVLGEIFVNLLQFQHFFWIKYQQ